MRIFLGIDNGSSGTLGAITEDGGKTFYVDVPKYKEKTYARSNDKYMTHLDYDQLLALLKKLQKLGDLVVSCERPMINPRMFTSSMSGARAHEVMLCALRTLGITLHSTMDSRDWQRPVLGEFGKGESKEKSVEKGCMLFPEHATFIKKHGDADGILIAYHLRNEVLRGQPEQKKDLVP